MNASVQVKEWTHRLW